MTTKFGSCEHQLDGTTCKICNGPFFETTTEPSYKMPDIIYVDKCGTWENPEGLHYTTPHKYISEQYHKEAIAALDEIYNNSSDVLYQEYRKSLAELENQWVSVKERLPDECQRVLIWNGLKVNEKDPQHWWQYQATIYRNGFHANNADKITHWQPLPPPPGVETK